jgi:hypothetical protein
MNPILSIIHREPQNILMSEQNNKWSIITVENSLKVTNYLNTTKASMLFVIITWK